MTPNRTPRVGDIAPDFRLVNGRLPDGKPTYFQLSEACQEAPVLIAFFPGAFTSTCTREMCRFGEDWSAFERLGARFVGVSVDSWPSLRAFREKHGLTLNFASDFDKAVTRSWDLVWHSWWGECSRRATFIIDRERRVRYAKVHASADEEPDYEALQAAFSALP